jgi:CheY-like chemotaxis protein
MKGIGMRVLLIEDDASTVRSIELMLKSEGFNVYTTDLGEEGVDLGKVYDHDIILLDLNLPDVSGFEVLRSLRLFKVKTPILILSGLAGTEDIRTAKTSNKSSSPPAGSATTASIAAAPTTYWKQRTARSWLLMILPVLSTGSAIASSTA